MDFSGGSVTWIGILTLRPETVGQREEIKERKRGGKKSENLCGRERYMDVTKQCFCFVPLARLVVLEVDQPVLL